MALNVWDSKYVISKVEFGISYLEFIAFIASYLNQLDSEYPTLTD